MATKKFDTVRSSLMEEISKLLYERGFDTLTTASNEITVPVVNAEGDEGYVVLVFKVPTGSRDGDAYDGYALAEEFRMKEVEKALKAEEAKAKKSAKIKADEEKRKAKAKAQEEKEG